MSDRAAVLGREQGTGHLSWVLRDAYGGPGSHLRVNVGSLSFIDVLLVNLNYVVTDEGDR